MQRSQTVCEPRVLCSLVNVQTKAKLLDATQPLKFRRVDQTNHQPAFCAVVAQRNDVMNWIAIDSLGQTLGPVSSGLGSQSNTESCMDHRQGQRSYARCHESVLSGFYGISE